MRLRSGLVCALVLAARIAPAAWAGEMTAIVHATLIDGTGKSPVPDAVVVVDGRRIVAAGPRGEVRVPAGAREIDASGKYIIPGLMDANVHLISYSNWDRIEFLARYEDRFDQLIEEAAQIALKSGLTTVFDTMGPLQPLVTVRDRINRGEVVGSRMFVAGNIVGFRAVFSTVSMPAATLAFQNRINAMWEQNMGPDVNWLPPEQLREETRKYIARGIDFFKYGLSGDGAPVNSEIGQHGVMRFSPRQQRVMIEECHRAGIIAQTHQDSLEGLVQAIEMGVDMVQHGAFTGFTPIPDSVLKLMLDRKIYSGIQTDTERRWRADLDRAEHAWPPEPYWVARLKNIHENEINMIRAGIPLLLATDAGVLDPDVRSSMPASSLEESQEILGEGHFLWLQAMVERGLTPMNAIVSATRNIAAAYHKLDQFGTLEPGKLADLLILDADPLQDIRNVRKIRLVMKDGAVIDRAALPLRKVLTVANR